MEDLSYLSERSKEVKESFTNRPNVDPNLVDCWIYTVLLRPISVHFNMLVLCLERAIWNQPKNVGCYSHSLS